MWEILPFLEFFIASPGHKCAIYVHLPYFRIYNFNTYSIMCIYVYKYIYKYFQLNRISIEINT